MKIGSNRAKHKSELNNSARQLEKQGKGASKLQPRTTHTSASKLVQNGRFTINIQATRKTQRKKTNKSKFRGGKFQDFQPHLAKIIARD